MKTTVPLPLQRGKGILRARTKSALIDPLGEQIRRRHTGKLRLFGEMRVKRRKTNRYIAPSNDLSNITAKASMMIGLIPEELLAAIYQTACYCLATITALATLMFAARA